MHLPCICKWDNIFRHGVLRETVIAEAEHIRLLRNKVYSPVFIDKPHADYIVAFPQQSLGNIITPWRILIVGVADLLTIEISDILVEERTQQQTGSLTRVFLIYIYMLTEPYGTPTPPSPVILVDGLPVRIVIVRTDIVLCGISLIEQRFPLPNSLRIGFHLRHHVFIVLIECRPLHQHGIVASEGICRDPRLDGRAAPAVDDDALRNLCLLKHPLAKEITSSREQPGILLRHRFPVNGCGQDIILHTMDARGVLYTEQADLGILVSINLLGILRIDTFDGHIDVRLSGQEPHITDKNIVYHQLFTFHFPAFHFHRERSSCLHLRKVHPPTALLISHSRILLLIEGDGHRLTSVSLSPNGDGFTTLEHHARLKKSG